MSLENGKAIDEIDTEELSWLEKREYNKFKNKIRAGIPKLEIGYLAVTDALKQIENLKGRKKKEKKKIEENIRADIIRCLTKSMDIIQITDEKTGKEETEETLEEKTTEKLLEYLLANIEEMKKFVEGK